VFRRSVGPDKEEAERKFHELMAKPEKRVDPESVAAIIDRFLDWTQTHREPGRIGNPAVAESTTVADLRMRSVVRFAFVFVKGGSRMTGEPLFSTPRPHGHARSLPTLPESDRAGWGLAVER
jgi:hypothetical protein